MGLEACGSAESSTASKGGLEQEEAVLPERGR